MEICEVVSFARVLSPSVVDMALSRWLVRVESSTSPENEPSASWTIAGVGELWWYQDHPTELEYWPEGAIDTIWINSGRLEQLCASVMYQQSRIEK